MPSGLRFRRNTRATAWLVESVRRQSVDGIGRYRRHAAAPQVLCGRLYVRPQRHRCGVGVGGVSSASRLKDYSIDGTFNWRKGLLTEVSCLVEPTESSPREAVLVIDFGSQYSHLIARRVRECRVYCEIVPHDAAWEDVQGLNPKGVILSGGPASVYEEDAPLAPGWVYDGGLPLLGICYGMQAMVHQLGGGVGRTDAREYGPATLHLNSSDSPLFDGLPGSFPVWMSHGDHITATPPGFEPLAHSDNSPIAALGNGNGAYGIQFHAEVEHTPLGKALLENFLFKVCGCEGEWSAGQLRGALGE